MWRALRARCTHSGPSGHQPPTAARTIPDSASSVGHVTETLYVLAQAASQVLPVSLYRSSSVRRGCSACLSSLVCACSSAPEPCSLRPSLTLTLPFGLRRRLPRAVHFLLYFRDAYLHFLWHPGFSLHLCPVKPFFGYIFKACFL